MNSRDLLTLCTIFIFSCLDLVGQNGEYSLEYLKLYQRLIVQEQWKYYLAIKGVLVQLGDLITMEVEKLQSLEETTLNSDLAQGFALKAFTGRLDCFSGTGCLKLISVGRFCLKLMVNITNMLIGSKWVKNVNKTCAFNCHY